ncbi:MAG: DUF2330 domain-containing protein [Polyangiales bacterium]
MKHARHLALALSLATLVPGVADACGGCFAPPQTVQVVTDHRMVLSLAAQQTTLWDQFSYSGRPENFSWILPIRYTERMRIEQASDVFMNLMSSITAPQVQPPTPPCRQNFAAPTAAGGSAENDGNAQDAGVTVLREQVVGPYEVRVIRGTDPMAMRDWLRDNGYSVPAAIEPIITYYTSMSADYIALKLRPGEGISRMSPIRVTMEGYQPSLPLRMIAAGVADKVGLQLMVVSTGRVEAMNFPNGELRDSDFVWDWARPGNPSADYLAAFNQLNRANGGRLWMTESAQRFERTSLESIARNQGGDSEGPGAGGDAGAPVDPADDVRVAFTGLGETAMVTRLRADMEGRMLDRDLALAASDRGERARLYQYGTIVNPEAAAQCQNGLGGSGTGTGAGTAGGGGTSVNGGSTPTMSSGGIRCAALPGLPSGNAALLSLTVLGLAAARLRRRAR